jgi:hypothetical protein
MYLHLGKSVLDCLQLNTFNDFLLASELYHGKFSQFEDALYLKQKS